MSTRISRRKALIGAGALAAAAAGLAAAFRGDPAPAGGEDAVLVFHPGYDIGFLGIEYLHPFDSHKYGGAWRELLARFGPGLTSRAAAPAAEAAREVLLRVHDGAYLDRLQDTDYLAGALELPLVAHLPSAIADWRVSAPMRRAVAGSLLGAELAMRNGFAVNLSGGYHHAKPARGEGFCIYSDIALAIGHLRRLGLLRPGDRVAYVDCDAHMGNGVAHCFMDDRDVVLMDMYNRSIYPRYDAEARARIDLDLPLSFGCDGERYLEVLRAELPGFLDAVAPRFAVYNAGTDPFIGDQLGGMNVYREEILERDRFVIDALLERRIPALMLPSGGYSAESRHMLADAAAYVVERMG